MAVFYASASKGLVFGPDGFDRVVQFVLRCMQMLLGLRAMALHIVMVGGAGTVHFLDGFIHVIVGGFQIVPVTHPVSNRDPGNE